VPLVEVYKYCICLDTTTIIGIRRVWRYKGVIRIRKSKDRQHNMTKRKSTNNDLQNIHLILKIIQNTRTTTQKVFILICKRCYQLLVNMDEGKQRQPNHNTTIYCVYWRTTATINPIIIRPHIVGRIMIGFIVVVFRQ
jgi:hypothetical protein